MASQPPHCPLNQALSPHFQQSLNSTPLVFWKPNAAFPEIETFSRKPSDQERKIGSIMWTPSKANDDKQSCKSRSPLSVIGKLQDFSPFDTTCQKRPENSPTSTHFLKRINSGLKKAKQSTVTPGNSLFQHSNEKEVQLETQDNDLAPLLEPFIFHSELLPFPDLDHNFGDSHSYHLINNNQPIAVTGFRRGRTLAPFQGHSGEKETRGVAADYQSSHLKEEPAYDGCNCRNTKCLKLYCECLRKGKICSALCNCSGCENQAHSELRQERVRYIEKKNPHAFKPIIIQTNNTEEGKMHNKGCNCRRSGCLKNYCECHQFGVRCTDACKCVECKNTVFTIQNAGKENTKKGLVVDDKDKKKNSKSHPIKGSL